MPKNTMKRAPRSFGRNASRFSCNWLILVAPIMLDVTNGNWFINANDNSVNYLDKNSQKLFNQHLIVVYFGWRELMLLFVV